MEIAAMLDASLYLPERREEVQDLGGSEVVEPDRETVGSLEPREPADQLKPLPDFRSEIPFQPEWVGPGKARDTIWEVTYIAHELGLISRPIDIAVEIAGPFTGDWAGFKACGDALANMANAAYDLNVNVRWIGQHIDAVWQGNVADACWLHTRMLERSLSQAPSVLEGYSIAYSDVVTRIQELEKRAAEVVAEALDWGIAALIGKSGLLTSAVQ